MEKLTKENKEFPLKSSQNFDWIHTYRWVGSYRYPLKHFEKETTKHTEYQPVYFYQLSLRYLKFPVSHLYIISIHKCHFLVLFVW